MTPPPPDHPGDATHPPSIPDEVGDVLPPRERVAPPRAHERSSAALSFSIQIIWTSAGEEREPCGSRTWEDFTGQSGGLDAVHPEDRPHLERAMARAQAERVPFECKFRLRRRDGCYFWMIGRGVPLLAADGSVREWVGVSTDIHSYRQAEDRALFLARAGEMLASSLDYDATLAALARLSVPMLGDWCLVDVLDPDGHFARAQVVTEPSTDAALVAEVRGLSPVPRENSIYPPSVALAEGRASLLPEVTDALLRQVAQSARHLSTMRRVGIRSLLTVPLLAHGRTLGALTFIFTRPDRRHDEADLRLAQELAHRAALSVENARLYREAQEAIRLRDEFLSIASHELKTPLTPLSLKLQALARVAQARPDAPLAPLVLSHVDAGLRQVRKLAELMSDLLDVSRIVGGSFQLRREPVDLAAVVRDVATGFASEAALAQTPLHVRAEGAIVGVWDRSRVEQVVANLVDNALKYGAGAPVRVSVAAEGGLARLTVRDEGIGIAPEQLGRIFDRYTRAVSERYYGGLGLGLYITRTIVEIEGGRVRVDSAPGRGATFVVELPLP